MLTPLCGHLYIPPLPYAGVAYLPGLHTRSMAWRAPPPLRGAAGHAWATLVVVNLDDVRGARGFLACDAGSNLPPPRRVLSFDSA